MNAQMTLDDFGISLDRQTWKYDEDNGCMMCRCPSCEGRMNIHLWTYWNPYKYCPYCGIRLQEGKFVNRYCQIYEEDKQKVMNVRNEYRKGERNDQE